MKLAAVIVTALVASATADPAPATRYPVRVKGKWGFIDKTGKLKIPARYDAHSEFSADGTVGVVLDKKVGRIDINGETLIPFEYELLRFQSEERSAALKGAECGYLDPKGAWAFKLERCESLGLGDFSEGLVLVTEDAKTRYYDKDGKLAFEVAGKGGEFHSGVAAVTRDRDKVLIDRTGKELVRPAGSKVSSGFSPGSPVLAVITGPKWGLIGPDMKVVLAPTYFKIGPFSDGLMAVSTVRDGEGYIDATGKVVIELAYEEAGNFSEGLAWVKTGDGVSAIDKTGKVVVAPTKAFDSAGELQFGLSLVRKRALVGLVDKKGKIVMPLADVQHMNWQWSGDLIGFTRGSNGKIFYVNRKGKTIWKE